MRFEFSAHGKKSLRKLDAQRARRILKKIAYWESTGDPLQYGEKLESPKKLLKYRVGDYRIIVWLHPERQQLIILEIDSRDHIYDTLIPICNRNHT
ncbi:type II toxin-antitoxin system mRNA interferase toxin, RelE/StbE family [Candidatus Peregrinibacteria bacterium]|nr:type II toxin-antitoxin system mRNA interferase toxin, RelE/StbE family [Candidatus Peregrinibacteria bacterium]